MRARHQRLKNLRIKKGRYEDYINKLYNTKNFVPKSYRFSAYQKQKTNRNKKKKEKVPSFFWDFWAI